jgi:hypothetical protein
MVARLLDFGANKPVCIAMVHKRLFLPIHRFIVQAAYQLLQSNC